MSMMIIAPQARKNQIRDNNGNGKYCINWRRRRRKNGDFWHGNKSIPRSATVTSVMCML